MVKFIVRQFTLSLVICLAAPFVFGGYYTFCGERRAEQQWLEQANFHLRILRWRCTDPDLKNVLDYAIHRYDRIGGWDVMFMPLPDADGVNCPFCPGITLDPGIMDYTIHDGAMILVHEALHDYWPYFGHDHVYPILERLEAL